MAASVPPQKAPPGWTASPRYDDVGCFVVVKRPRRRSVVCRLGTHVMWYSFPRVDLYGSRSTKKSHCRLLMFGLTCCHRACEFSHQSCQVKQQTVDAAFTPGRSLALEVVGLRRDYFSFTRATMMMSVYSSAVQGRVGLEQRLSLSVE